MKDYAIGIKPNVINTFILTFYMLSVINTISPHVKLRCGTLIL